MFKLNINLNEKSYPIYVTTDFTGFIKAFGAARITGKIAVVTDSNVEGLYCEEFMKCLSDAGYEVYKYVIKAGENSKNLNTVTDIYKFLSSHKLDRNSALIALGGGVTGDITGFAAATYLRGINFIQVPTTLLAQADSSVGGKVGVDFEGNKNIIGAFYQPRFVYVNVNTLKTLPERELKAGLAEVLKHGLIADKDFFEYIVYNLKKLFSFDENVLIYITKMNCSIKGRVVEQDEQESGLRAILNLGHTIGHAIETISQFQLLHGECVSIGIIGAYILAQKLDLVTGTDAEQIKNIFEKAGLPTRKPGLNIEDVYNAMFHDKKIKDNNLTFILPKSIGEVIQCSIDDEELIKSVLHEIIE